jgi:universal stress protein E
MNTLNSILVAVDFSTGSRSALEQAARITCLQGAKLNVLHVIDESALKALARSHGSNFEKEASKATAGASAAMDRWLETIKLPACCQIHIVIGHPLHEILEQTRRLEADLLVAGITGSGLSTSGVGAVSGKLARKAPCRVLLVRTDLSHPFHRVVACVDFSDTSLEVITAARRIAIKDAARVDFLHVWQDPWVALPYSAPFGEVGMPSLIVSTPEQRATLVNNLSAELHDFVSETAEGIQSAEVLREAISYGEGIVDYAKEVTADLIIIGHKGHSKLHDILLGSTPERLLTKSPCSILLVKPPAQA